MTEDPPLPCPLCGAPALAEGAPGEGGTLRRCPRCQAELRNVAPGRWKLEYLHPDWLPESRTPPVPVADVGGVLLKTHTWEEWTALLGGRPLPANPVAAAAEGLEPGERVLASFADARLVIPHTHQPHHALGPSGSLYITDRYLRCQVGLFRWSVPRTQVRRVTDVGGLLEVVWGPTDEPLHVALPGAAEAAAQLR